MPPTTSAPPNRAVSGRMDPAVYECSSRGVKRQNGALPADEIHADIMRESQGANAAGVDLRDAAHAKRQLGRHEHCSCSV